jgi:pyruvate formate lyase activating enzyme
MKIGGFVKQSLIDYPGKIAAVVFTRGCNFRCGYCHNPDLVVPELFKQHQLISVNEVLMFLKERKSWLDGVVVSGGEPTIHKDLPAFLKTLKDMGFSVKLDTNGSNPSMLDHIIDKKLVDYVAMDIKSSLNATEYAQVIGLKIADTLFKKVIASIGILRNSNIEVEFRTTKLPGIHEPPVFENIYQYIGKDARYSINEYRKGRTIGSLLCDCFGII